MLSSSDSIMHENGLGLCDYPAAAISSNSKQYETVHRFTSVVPTCRHSRSNNPLGYIDLFCHKVCQIKCTKGKSVHQIKRQ